MILCINRINKYINLELERNLKNGSKTDKNEKIMLRKKIKWNMIIKDRAMPDVLAFFLFSF